MLWKLNNNKNSKSLDYDYLVIALGSETKFFGMSDIQENAFTIKNLNDAIRLRNHIIYILEQSDQLLNDTDGTLITTTITSDNTDTELQKRLLTFVIVGGGFAGVETAGEINDFIKDSVKGYYHNIGGITKSAHKFECTGLQSTCGIQPLTVCRCRNPSTFAAANYYKGI